MCIRDRNSDTDSIRTFIDTFPAGTLSGAPKVRAMQLISELEPHNRGAYGGCIGSVSYTHLDVYKRQVTYFRYPRLSWLDGRCVQGPGTYSPRHG